jgi:7,8-dihydropterin-6-yl-methyl-4-(beta-D-ribofuranosyl)aminobenzene 5'-phosphate synthase
MQHVKHFLLLTLAALSIIACEGQNVQQQWHVQSVHITILSTNLAEEGDGEWGFAALVEADGHRILFVPALIPKPF